MPKTEIKFCGFDSWCRPVFTDQKGNLYIDVALAYPDFDRVVLYTKCNNSFNGEPDSPVNMDDFVLVHEFSDL